MTHLTPPSPPTPTGGVGAYAKSLVGFGGTTVVAAMSAAYVTPDTLAALAVSGLGDLGTYFVRNRSTGWRRYAKAICSWAGTIAAAVPLALTTYEGDQHLLVTGMDGSDWAKITLLAARSVLVTLIPNAQTALTDLADGDVGGAAAVLEHAVLDVPEPVVLRSGGDAVQAAAPATAMLTAITDTTPRPAGFAPTAAPAPAPAAIEPEEVPPTPSAAAEQAATALTRAGTIMARLRGDVGGQE